MENSEHKTWPVWLMASLGFITIIGGIITICAPAIFWKFLDIILGIFFIFSGISTIINTLANGKKYVGCYIALASLIILLGFLLTFSSSQLVGTITIRSFAIWALLRGILLIYYGITNKQQQNYRRAILGLGVLLFILAIIIICVPKSESRTWAGVCIGISTVFDGIWLLILSFRMNEDPSLQDKLVEQANQNEIANTATPTDGINNTTTTVSTEQATPAVQVPAPEVQQPAPTVQVPIPEALQPTPAVQQPTSEAQQPTPETQVPTPEAQQPTPEAQQPTPEAQQPTPETQAPQENTTN